MIMEFFEKYTMKFNNFYKIVKNAFSNKIIFLNTFSMNLKNF